MTPFNLIREGRTDVIAQACSKCGTVYMLHMAQQAEECCDRDLKAARDKERNDAWRVKSDAEHAANMERRIAEAKRVPYAEYKGGMIYSEEQDEYYSEWEELVDACECDDQPVPQHAWGTIGLTFCIPSAPQIVESATENGDWHDDIADRVEASAELIAAVDAFNAEQTDTTYHVDYKVLVLAPVDEVSNALS